MRLKFLTILLLLSSYGYSQNLFPEPGPVFDDSGIPRVDVLIATTDLETLLAEGNEFSNVEFPVTFIFTNGMNSDTLEEVGFRLRGNTSRTADKKSFKLSFNTFVNGRKFHGLEKMNINGSHNDPTNARVKIALDLAAKVGVPGPRANHVKLYINDSYFGLYTNVEHMDEEFVDLRFGNKSGNLYKCLWPAQLNYLGTNPALYKFENSGRRAYELKTNTYNDDYSDMAHFIDVLNNTSLDELACELEQVFNVDTYLKAVAYEMLIGHWDNYIFNKNNFYLYHNLESSQFEYILFDVDNTLGINWFAGNFDFSNRNIYNWSAPGEPRPMYTRMLEVQKYRDRLSLFINQQITTHLHPDSLAPIANDLRQKIQPSMIADPLYSLDYGFTIDDFNESFTESVGYWFIPHGIGSFVQTRYNAALTQLQLNSIAPVFTQVQSTPSHFGEPISITAKVYDDEQITAVNLYHQINGATQATISMLDDGMNNDGAANDGVYGAVLPAINEDAVITYFLDATDNNNELTTFPECDNLYHYVGSSALPLRINEVMSANTSTIADEAGEYDDWIELHNFGTEDIDLSGMFLTDNPSLPEKWPFPEICIKAGAYLLLWADKDPEQGATHCNFKLSSDGERLVLLDTEENNFAQMDIVDYPAQSDDDSWARLPNGDGPFASLDASPGYSNDPNATTELNNSNFQIQPNPASDLVQITLDDFYLNFDLRILDGSGRLVFSGSGHGLDYFLDVSGFSQGVYFMEIVLKDGRVLAARLIRM